MAQVNYPQGWGDAKHHGLHRAYVRAPSAEIRQQKYSTRAVVARHGTVSSSHEIFSRATAPIGQPGRMESRPAQSPVAAPFSIVYSPAGFSAKPQASLTSFTERKARCAERNARNRHAFPRSRFLAATFFKEAILCLKSIRPQQKTPNRIGRETPCERD
jgi:hypothetical protein